MAAQGLGKTLAPDVAGISQSPKTTPKLPTPLPNGAGGALGGGAAVMAGRGAGVDNEFI